MHIGELIRQERLRRHLSQEELAEALGISSKSISRWEKGQVIPQAHYRLQLSRFFDISLEVLFDASQDNQEDLQTAPLWHVPYNSHPFFTGREEVLHQLVTKLCTQPGSIQAITGLPGVGKTSLAIELAHHPQIREHFRDGILWIGLGPTPQIEEALNSWVTLLGITSTKAQALTTLNALTHWLHQHLRDRQMLLILDDAWKVSDAVVFQVEGKQCVHVVTTRSPLLAYTFARDAVTSLPPLSEAASLQLLHHLAPLASQRYPSELQTLIQPSGGLPLALTLLGRSVHVQSLHGSPRRLLRTLQHLSHDIQTRFQVAEPVSMNNARPSAPVGTEISLHDREGLARIWLFRGRMAELCGEIMQAQHAYFEGLALASELHHQELLPELLVLVGGTLGDTDVSSQAEHYLLEGLRAIEQFEDETSLSLVFQYLGELAYNFGKTAEALSFYTRGLTIAHQTHNKKTAGALLQNLGALAAHAGDPAQATAYYEEGLTYAREIDDLQRQSALLMNLGMQAWYAREPGQAIRLSQESLKIAQEIGHQMRISSVMQNLGMMMRCQDQFAMAEQYLQESLDLAQRIGHRWLFGETLGEIGFLALKQQQTTRAKQIFEEVQQHAQEIQAPLLRGYALFGLAQVAEQEGQCSEALALAQECLSLCAQINHQILIQEIETWRVTLAEKR